MTTTIIVSVTLELVSGPEQDEYTVLDAFAGAIGEQNAAQTPLRIGIGWDDAGERQSVYKVTLVDEAVQA
jgi:hypothetical protein